MSGIDYSEAPGRVHQIGTCRARVIGHDYRRGYGPAFVQYRCRCEAHAQEWSGAP